MPVCLRAFACIPAAYVRQSLQMKTAKRMWFSVGASLISLNVYSISIGLDLPLCLLMYLTAYLTIRL